jgi:GT2 family glycosyltransferase
MRRNAVRLFFDFATSAAEKGWRAFREGRLPASPRRWLRDLRHHFGEVVEHGPQRSAPQSSSLRAARAVTSAGALAELREFLASGRCLSFAVAAPRVSVLIPLYNRAELTLRALRSLPAGVEVVLVDNASSDDTPALLARLDGAVIVRNAKNRGFVDAINQAAAASHGEVLLLLNSDAELLPGSLEAGLAALSDGVAAVGARLILPDGKIQEAGSIIWRDGWCQGYGRGLDPDAPEVSFARDVDFASAACLLVRRDAFDGLDERYRPAYFEDVDLCVGLWQSGRRVVYEPRFVARHVEFASSSSPGAAAELQKTNHARFVEKHAAWLAAQPARSDGALTARARRRGLRILFIDDRAPLARFGSGHPRAASLVAALDGLGHAVTAYSTAFADQRSPTRPAELPRTVELVEGGEARLAAFLAERLPHVDRVVVSRAANLARVRRALGGRPCPVPLIYDAEAIAALRDGDSPDDEARAAVGADVVLVVSDAERAIFERSGARRVVTLGHALTPRFGPGFAMRAGVVFVGAFYDPDSPNSDAACWLVDEIWPHLRDLQLTIAGPRPPRRVRALARPGIDVLGAVADLTPLYDRARVFVAPTRRAAGLPHKVHAAAAAGLPVVATSLLAAQLGWRDELSVADEPAAFAAAILALHDDAARWQAQRERASAAITRDCDPARFSATLAAALA